MEGSRNLSFSSVKRPKRANMHFMAVKKLTRRSGFVIYLLLKTVHLQQLKGMQSSKLGTCM